MPSVLFYFSSLYLRATLYFIPSFSISAITQSVIHGMPGGMRLQQKINYEIMIRLSKGRLAIVLTFCIQTIHHRLNNVQFGFDGEVDEIGVD